MKCFRDCPEPHFEPQTTMTEPGSSRSAWRLLACFLALAIAGTAAGADITATPPVGGGFVVTNADKTVERFRVNEDGSVTIPGTAQLNAPILNGPVVVNALKTPDYEPLGNILVCLDTTTGKLARCTQWSPSSPAGGPIYVKKAVFDVGMDFSVQTFQAECDRTTDKAIAGVAVNQNFSTNRIANMDYTDNYFRAVLTVADVDRLTITVTCMRAL